jgi:hypothetical protein
LRTAWPGTHRRFISTTCGDSTVIPRDYRDTPVLGKDVGAKVRKLIDDL